MTAEKTLAREPDSRIDIWRKICAFVITSLAGMSDASLGAQLDSMQQHYHLSYTVVSLIFLSNVVGYLTACCINPFFLHRLGTRKTLLFAATVHASGALIIAMQPPFSVTVIALTLLGLGAGLNDASLSTYIAFFDDATLMSIFYASFGLGSLASPLIIAGMLDKGVRWTDYYWLPFGLSIVAILAAWPLFKNYHPPPNEATASEHVRKRILQAIRKPVVLTGCLVVALSFASGDILSSWVISFMTSIRHGKASSMRYVLAGFWGGQALGRFFLSFPNARYGVHKTLFCYLLVSIALLSLLQFWNDVPADATAIALFGFFLGPITPSMISTTSSVVPPSLVSPVVSWMTAIGLLGAAIGPLLVGFVNSAGGLRYLGAILMGLMGIMLSACLYGLRYWRKEK